MIKTFKTLAIASLTMAFAATAFAGPTGGNAVNIPFEEFKGRCENPDNYPNQREPRQIKIQCTNVEHEFVPSSPGTVDLVANRQVTTAIFSDKFNVSPSVKDYPISQKPGSCMQYKEVEKTITIEKPLTCADVLSNIKGDVNDYCASSLDMAKGTTPKSIEIRDTGRVIPCGNGGPIQK